jgi:hypothetical protein
MIPLKVKISQIKPIWSKDGREGGLLGNERTEPYLWTLFLKIDGTNIKQHKDNPFILNGRLQAKDIFIGKLDTDIWDNIPSNILLDVPPMIGEWNTETQPIEIKLSGKSEFVNGVAILCYALIEQDLFSDQGISKGYSAFTSTVVNEVNNAIREINLLYYVKNNKFDFEKFRSEKLSDIQSKAQEAAKRAIIDSMNFIQKLLAVANPDDLIGSSIYTEDIQAILWKQKAYTDKFTNEGVWEVYSSMKCGYVTIYEHVFFNGKSQELFLGLYNTNDLIIGNDTMSSIKIPAGIQVTLYEHADKSGRFVRLTGDVDDFRSIVAHEFLIPSPIGGFNSAWDKIGVNLNDIVSCIEIAKI